MRKAFKNYLLLWAIGFVLFQVITWATPSELAGYSKFGGGFWPGYVCITLTYLGQLACTWRFLKADSAERLFLNIPVLRLGYAALVISVIVGVLSMAIPDLPYWVGLVVCVLVLAAYAAAIVKAKAAADIVEETGARVKQQTQFIRLLTVEAEGLMLRAQSDAAKAEAKRVYEAIRYSNPVSSEALADIEAQIRQSFTDFAANLSGSAEEIKAKADELVAMIGARNSKCKVLI